MRIVLVRNTRSRKRWMKLMEKGPLLTATHFGKCFVLDLGHCVERPRGRPPSPALPGLCPTPRPREPKPTPGTVAFPLAPLHCRSSIYTMFGAGNLLQQQN